MFCYFSFIKPKNCKREKAKQGIIEFITLFSEAKITVHLAKQTELLSNPTFCCKYTSFYLE